MRPVVTEIDNARLRGLMGTPAGRRHSSAMRLLLDKLNTARIVSPSTMPSTIMTMNSTAACWDGATGASRDLTLVYPWNANPVRGRLSVLSRAGIELLAATPGSTVPLDDGTRLQIAFITYQPEAERQLQL